MEDNCEKWRKFYVENCFEVNYCKKNKPWQDKDRILKPNKINGFEEHKYRKQKNSCNGEPTAPDYIYGMVASRGGLIK